MQSQPRQTLLTECDPSPVRIFNPAGTSPFMLLGDHAGNLVPTRLGSLGLTEGDMRRHIAWDLGVAELGERLAAALDATFISQRYSRLVIDCNRDPAADDAMPDVSDGTMIAANLALSADDRVARIQALFAPYHAAIAAELTSRLARERETLLISLHSFTPRLRGEARPWQIGILYGGGDVRFARALLEALAQRGDLVVGDNQPYAMDGVDYTIPRHAFPPNLPYAETEIRQDMLSASDRIDQWVEDLASALNAARDAIVSAAS